MTTASPELLEALAELQASQEQLRATFDRLMEKLDEREEVPA